MESKSFVHGIVVMFLFFIVLMIIAKEVAMKQIDVSQGNLIDNMVDKVVQRLSSRAWPHLENVVLGKPGSLASSARDFLQPLLSLRSHKVCTRCSPKVTSASRGSHFHRVGMPIQHVQGDVRTSASANPFADLGKGAMEKMMGVEKDPEADKRVKEGKMTFDDFLNSMKMMEKVKGLQNAMKLVPGMAEKMPSAEQMQEAEDRLQLFTKIVNGMTDEERKNPDLFFDTSDEGLSSMRERITRIAATTGLEPQDVGQFFVFFRGQRELTARLAQGETLEEIEREMKQEAVAQEQGGMRIQAAPTAPPANRAQRRAQKKKDKAKTKSSGFR